MPTEEQSNEGVYFTPDPTPFKFYGLVTNTQTVLTDEEYRLLEAFRRFRAVMLADHATFQWTTYVDPGVLVAPERVLVVTPKEAGYPCK